MLTEFTLCVSFSLPPNMEVDAIHITIVKMRVGYGKFSTLTWMSDLLPHVKARIPPDTHFTVSNFLLVKPPRSKREYKVSYDLKTRPGM